MFCEYVEGDIEYVGKSLKETVVPEVSCQYTGSCIGKVVTLYITRLFS